MRTTGARRFAAAGRLHLHKVGLTAVGVGLPSLLFLPFAIFRHSRIQTGVAWSSLEAIGPVWLSVLAALWLVLALLSTGIVRGRPAALLRGLAADTLIAAIMLSTGIAATRGVALGTFARVSVGAGVWIGLVACFMVILASRRELAQWRAAKWLVILAAPAAVAVLGWMGAFANTGIAKEYANYQARYYVETINHMLMSATAVGIATVVGIVLGILAFSYRRLERPVFTSVNILQTIPSLAAIVLLIPVLSGLVRMFPALRTVGISGSGWAPVIVVLTMYALLAISVNTDAGLRAVPPAAVDAGAGMGMTRGQLMSRVRLPIATPVVFTGVRTSAVQTVGNATLAAFIGAGGLGIFIFQGMAQQSPDLILLGSLTLVALAVLTDGALRLTERLVSPRARRAGRDRSAT